MEKQAMVLNQGGFEVAKCNFVDPSWKRNKETLLNYSNAGGLAIMLTTFL